MLERDREHPGKWLSFSDDCGGARGPPGAWSLVRWRRPVRGVRNTKFGYRCSKTGPNGKIRGGLFSGGGKGERRTSMGTWREVGIWTGCTEAGCDQCAYLEHGAWSPPSSCWMIPTHLLGVGALFWAWDACKGWAVFKGPWMGSTRGSEAGWVVCLPWHFKLVVLIPRCS